MDDFQNKFIIKVQCSARGHTPGGNTTNRLSSSCFNLSMFSRFADVAYLMIQRLHFVIWSFILKEKLLEFRLLQCVRLT